MTDSRIRLERDDDGVAVLTMQDEAESNALSEPFIEQLLAALEQVGADSGARVCVLRGLEEVFCAGGHKDMLAELAAGRVAASDIMVTRAIIEVPIPTIAAMEGHAVGGGLILGLACDIALLGRESRYGCSFMNMGFTPGMGTTRLLQDAVGEHRAAEMMFGGQFFRGSHFETCSGINYVLPKHRVWPKALSVAGRIAEKPRHALELLKRSLSLRKRLLFEEARTMESMMHEICFARPETAQLIEENYAETKR
ncbi:MAG: enoyl-CoA hydratase/isomerase family protein [Deltaproteobacteria bacterium]|jgi:polyketide biosynthesis enoyl-CoA hydratase PksI|nr:enoyl-CoA hydratase/isomerase family protein [Deltaproteobacteria bacterium]MBW2536575.1 enoyl-CoA hydratase/isomerase family protein [Deltaproteobacteria bacterium]